LGHCGLVIGEDETTGKRKLYAGAVSGSNQRLDEQELITWGHEVNLGVLSGFLAFFREGVAGNF